MVNFARFLGVDAENSLELTNRKFINRFTLMESAAADMSKKLSEMTLAEMDAMWNEIKQRKE
jgi:XTP/dITP diphosphohydrolase